jgi:hypothetical protein
VRDVMERRADHLASGGLARRHDQRIIFVRHITEALRRRQLEAASARLSAEKGLALRQKASTSPASIASLWRGPEACSPWLTISLASSLFLGGRLWSNTLIGR